MIEVSVLDSRHVPLAPGERFELVSPTGELLRSALADDAGVVTFDIDSAGLGAVGLRVARDPVPDGNAPDTDAPGDTGPADA